MATYILAQIFKGQKYPFSMQTSVAGTDYAGYVHYQHDEPQIPGAPIPWPYDNAQVQAMKALNERSPNPVPMLFQELAGDDDNGTYRILGNDLADLQTARQFFTANPIAGAVPTILAGREQWLNPFYAEPSTDLAPAPSGASGPGFVQVTVKGRFTDQAAAQASIDAYLSPGWDATARTFNPALPSAWVGVDADDPAGTDPLFFAKGIAGEPGSGSIWGITGWTVIPAQTAYDISWTAAADPDAADAAWVATRPDGATAFRYRFDSGSWGPAIRLGSQVRTGWQTLGSYEGAFTGGAPRIFDSFDPFDPSDYTSLKFVYEWLDDVNNVIGRSETEALTPAMIRTQQAASGAADDLRRVNTHVAGRSLRLDIRSGGGLGAGLSTSHISAGAGVGSQILYMNPVHIPSHPNLFHGLVIWGVGNANERGRVSLLALR